MTAVPRISRSTPVPSTLMCGAAGSVPMVEGAGRGDGVDLPRVAEVDVVTQDGPGHRAVHGTGVQVTGVDRLREAAGDRGLAGA